jgi:hypothetical protein
MAAIAVNNSPVPAHADLCKGFIFPQTHGTECFHSKKACEQALIDAGGSGNCIRSTGRQ